MVDDLRSRSSAAAVRTHAVPVRIFTRTGVEIRGNAHVKPGAYQQRVSDLLNLGKVKYIAITEAEYVMPGEVIHTTECVLLNIDDIVLMDVGGSEAPTT